MCAVCASWLYALAWSPPPCVDLPATALLLFLRTDVAVLSSWGGGLCMRTSSAPFDRSSVRSLVIRTCGEWVRVLYAVFAGICCVARDIGCLEIRDSSRFLRAFFFILACFMSCIEVPEPFNGLRLLRYVFSFRRMYAPRHFLVVVS